MLLRRYHKEITDEPKEDTKEEVIEEVNLLDLTVKELKEKAKELDIEGCSDMKKEDLIEAIEGE